jgi:site-specific recombinase XerD
VRIPILGETWALARRLNLALGATVNTYVAAVKSFLGFAHRVGFTRFNAGPLIKLKKAPRQIVQRILSEVSVAMLIGAAKTDRDRLMFDLLRGTARPRAGQLDVGSGHWARQRRGAT